MAKFKGRARGRRALAKPEIEKKFKTEIIPLGKERDKLEAELETVKSKIGKKCDQATKAGVETSKLAEWLNRSRQGVYKTIREFVDGLTPGGKPSGRGDGSPAKVSTTKSKSKGTKTTKAKAAPKKTATKKASKATAKKSTEAKSSGKVKGFGSKPKEEPAEEKAETKKETKKKSRRPVKRAKGTKGKAAKK